MGQADILNFLELHKDKEFTTNEISKILKMTTSNISIRCSKLRQNKEVNFRVIMGRNNQRNYIYRYKK